MASITERGASLSRLASLLQSPENDDLYEDLISLAEEAFFMGDYDGMDYIIDEINKLYNSLE